MRLQLGHPEPEGHDNDVVVIAGARTPFGNLGGSVAELSATDLGVAAAEAAIERSGVPKEQIDDYYRRQDHSIESIYRVWLKAPGVMVLDEGPTMVERRLTERVTILSANNDAVVLDIDSQTHLPRRRTFEWRNETFKDRDEDAEEYDDWHIIQGLPTAFTITRYHNGDMASQTFLSKVEYDVDLTTATFDPNILLEKKGKEK